MTDRISIRGIAVATSVVVATTGLTLAVHDSTAQPELRPTGTATRIAPQQHDVSMERTDIASGKHLADRRVAHRRQHARAVRAAHEARADRRARAQERASRSSVRTVGSSGARGIAASMASSRYGWGSDQFSCLDSLWERESGWNVHAQNPSGAYGIPQALPGSKMGANWRDDAATQIAWGLGYINGRYGSPCGAWDAFEAKGWY